MLLTVSSTLTSTLYFLISKPDVVAYPDPEILTVALVTVPAVLISRVTSAPEPLPTLLNVYVGTVVYPLPPFVIVNLSSLPFTNTGVITAGITFTFTLSVAQTIGHCPPTLWYSTSGLRIG